MSRASRIEKQRKQLKSTWFYWFVVLVSDIILVSLTANINGFRTPVTILVSVFAVICLAVVSVMVYRDHKDLQTLYKQ